MLLSYMLNVLDALFLGAQTGSPGNPSTTISQLLFFQGLSASSSHSGGPDVQGSVSLNRLQISIFALLCSLLGRERLGARVLGCASHPHSRPHTLLLLTHPWRFKSF